MWLKKETHVHPSVGREARCNTCTTEAVAGTRRDIEVRYAVVPHGYHLPPQWTQIGEHLHYCPQHTPPTSLVDDLEPDEGW